VVPKVAQLIETGICPVTRAESHWHSRVLVMPGLWCGKTYLQAQALGGSCNPKFHLQKVRKADIKARELLRHSLYCQTNTYQNRKLRQKPYTDYKIRFP